MATKEFGQALRVEMERSKLSQPQVAAATGVSQSVLSQYLTGQRVPALGSMVKLIGLFPRLVFWLVAYVSQEAGQ